jgi:hypothetical protein
MGQKNKFLCTGPNRTFNRLVPLSTLFALPVAFFCGFAFIYQKNLQNDCCNKNRIYLKSEGRLSIRLHFSHSAWFFTLPFAKVVFILTSPPQEQKNFWVALDVREFLLA